MRLRPEESILAPHARGKYLSPSYQRKVLLVPHTALHTAPRTIRECGGGRERSPPRRHLRSVSRCAAPSAAVCTVSTPRHSASASASEAAGVNNATLAPRRRPVYLIWRTTSTLHRVHGVRMALAPTGRPPPRAAPPPPARSPAPSASAESRRAPARARRPAQAGINSIVALEKQLLNMIRNMV